MRPSGKARLAAVIGWPVAQSLSPRLHGHWLEAYGIDGLFLPLAVRPENFSAVVGGLRLAGFQGISVTLPHKEAAVALAHRLDADARAAGAANLLVFRSDGTMDGLNTDVAGFARSLSEEGVSLRGNVAVLLGAGGAARAVALGLAAGGAREIRVFNRHRARAQTLVRELSPFVIAKLKAHGFEDWPEAAGDASLVVNATSAGMAGAPGPDLSLEPLPAGAAICDIVYNPLETDLLKRARGRGFKTIDGLGMLMHQAAPAFCACFGVEPAVTPQLRRELEQALSHDA